jgi:hypothetical protein
MARLHSAERLGDNAPTQNAPRRVAQLKPVPFIAWFDSHIASFCANLGHR